MTRCSETHTLRIDGLCASAGGKEILRGVDLEVSSGRVHVVMGPNGSGKSTLAHVVTGRPGYQVTAGSVTLDGADMLRLVPWERAQAGLFLGMQHPTEVPGVSTARALAEALALRAGSDGPDEALLARTSKLLEAEAAAVGLKADLVARPLNVDMSGGEKKRNETVQLAVLQPHIAILDEIDSGLDIDALRSCANRIEALTETGLGVLAITHFTRVLEYLRPDEVHVIVDGRIVDSGGPELAEALEERGYAPYLPDERAAGVAVSIGGLGRPQASSAGPASAGPGRTGGPLADPWADPLDQLG
ncbi:Fe-S cluster assembly ATPase SufC [Candidatus Poriferisodalis sp.]|uniref:Fe-S cluster assembly ATPase SufC n=1 Tax=Candidatus Poriferisodalis sp. TaxID=3101277 RepID=UPI003B019E0F